MVHRPVTDLYRQRTGLRRRSSMRERRIHPQSGEPPEVQIPCRGARSLLALGDLAPVQFLHRTRAVRETRLEGIELLLPDLDVGGEDRPREALGAGRCGQSITRR